MEKMKVYSREDCVQCKATVRKADELNLDYEYIDLETVAPEIIQGFRDEGLLQAPVVEANGERWSGFRPDKLGEVALRAIDLP